MNVRARHPVPPRMGSDVKCQRACDVEVDVSQLPWHRSAPALVYLLGHCPIPVIVHGSSQSLLYSRVTGGGLRQRTPPGAPPGCALGVQQLWIWIRALLRSSGAEWSWVRGADASVSTAEQSASLRNHSVFAKVGVGGYKCSGWLASIREGSSWRQTQGEPQTRGLSVTLPMLRS